MCEYAVLLSGHIDQMNTAAEEAQLQAHLAQCAHCRELLRQMQANDAALKQLSADPPADLTQCIMQGVRSQPKKCRSKRLIPIFAAAAATAAMLGFALTSVLPTFFATKDAASFEAVADNAEASPEMAENINGYNAQSKSAATYAMPTGANAAADDAFDGFCAPEVVPSAETFATETEASARYDGESENEASYAGYTAVTRTLLPQSDGDSALLRAAEGWFSDWLNSMTTLLTGTGVIK